VNKPSATVRPFRFYRGFLTPEGRGLVIRGNPSGPDLEALMREGAVDVTDLADKLPIALSSEELKDLHFAVNLMRVTTNPEDAPSFQFDALQGVSQRVEKSLDVLRQDLPKLIEHHRDFDGARATESAEVFAKILSAANEYLAERWVAWGGRTPLRRHAWWHDDAIYLHCVLDTAARRQGKPLFFSYPDAPAVAFIDEALSLAKVQHGSREAIARRLARYEADTEQQLKTMRRKRPVISAT
jgi:hypothetical protein